MFVCFVLVCVGLLWCVCFFFQLPLFSDDFQQHGPLFLGTPTVFQGCHFRILGTWWSCRHGMAGEIWEARLWESTPVCSLNIPPNALDKHPIHHDDVTCLVSLVFVCIYAWNSKWLPLFLRKDLILKGSSYKAEDKQVSGIYTLEVQDQTKKSLFINHPM